MLASPLPWYRAYPGDLAAAVGLVPLGWCVALWLRRAALVLRGRTRPAGYAVDPAYWYVACGLAVSFVADRWALRGSAWLPSTVYPVLQAAMIGSALRLQRTEVVAYTGTLMTAGVVGVVWWGGVGPDVFLHTVAFLSVAGLALMLWRHDRLRHALAVQFGAGWLAYLVMIADLRVPGTPAWFSPGWWAFQSIRLIGALLVCRAIAQPTPSLAAVAARSVA